MKRKAAILSGFLIFVFLGCTPLLFAGEAGMENSSPGAGNEIPYKQEGSVDGAAVVKSFVTLIILLAAAGAVAFFFKRSNFAKKLGVSESKYIHLIELKRLSPKLVVYLIRVQGKCYLLTQSGEHVNVVEHSGDMEKELQNQQND